MHYLAETGLLSLKLSQRKMMPFEQWEEEVKIQRAGWGESARLGLIPSRAGKWIPSTLYINQSISLTVHRQRGRVMNDLSAERGQYGAWDWT